MRDVPSVVTYSSVVARDSIRILLTLAALNGLEVLSTDIQGAYLYATPREKAYFIAGEEFGDRKGCIVKIVRALYGMKSSGAAFRAKLADDLKEFGYSHSLGDPDVWMRARTNKDGGPYYEYISVYVDDLLIISHDPKYFCEKLMEIYKLKQGFEKPGTFLGAELPRFENNSKDTCFGLSSHKYLVRVLEDLETRLDSRGMKLFTSVSPMDPNYHAETDNSSFLDEGDTNWYQGLIGTLRWLVEIGRIDISHAVCVLSSYLTCPREGHFLAALRIFGFLRSNKHHTIIFDPQMPNLRRCNSIVREEWLEFYGGVKESLPYNMPEPRGQSVVTWGYVDADHARDIATRRSHTGIIIYVNSSPILWFSKKQGAIQTSTHGAEMMGTRIAVEMAEALRYKLRMFGVSVDGPTILFCDNQSVVHNANHPESTLKKKHIAISFHKIREAVAAGVVEIHKVGTVEN